MPKGLLSSIRSNRSTPLQEATVRDFGGGLNVIDNDLNLSSKYSVVENNLFRAADGSKQVRWGTKLFSNLATATGGDRIVHMAYFVNHIIAVTDMGEVYKVDSAGTATVIWDDTIAAALTIPVSGRLGNNPFSTTNASTTVTVTHEAHGLAIADNVTFSLADETNSVPDTELNDTHAVVSVIDSDTYTITVTTAATSTGSGGGSFVVFEHSAYSVDGWGYTPLATSAEFNGELIICNGSDKPLIVDDDLTCQYLFDIATSSNIHTPIASFVRTFGNYLVMAGDPVYPDMIHISNSSSSGTWYGDVDSDGTQINLGSRVPSGSSIIRGIGAYRGDLIVLFDNAIILGRLGIFDGSTHKPDFDEAIEGIGGNCHNSIQTLGDDTLFLDLVGVPSMQRTKLTKSLEPNRPSQLVDPAIQKYLNGLSLATIQERCFSVYNKHEGQYMVFIPNDNQAVKTTETVCFVYTSIKKLSVTAWSMFRDWNFTAACRSQGGRVFFAASDGRIYVYGNQFDPINTDYIDNPDLDVPADGVPVKFDWELPWSDVNDRMSVKLSRYIGIDTKGAAEFTAEMFVDNIRYNDDGSDNPQLTMKFVGGDVGGFGSAAFGSSPFGGGRNTSLEKLWAWPARFKLMKLRFHGTVTQPLRLVTISIMYQRGSIRR